MSRGFDFLVVGVVWSVSIIMHLISIRLFQPGSALHDIASDATLLDGAAKADFWFEILAVYMPLLMMAGILAWAALKEYRRQAITARRPIP
jgi:hypothetical protein